MSIMCLTGVLAQGASNFLACVSKQLPCLRRSVLASGMTLSRSLVLRLVVFCCFTNMLCCAMLCLPCAVLCRALLSVRSAITTAGRQRGPRRGHCTIWVSAGHAQRHTCV
jgi:hypothetical protein